MAAWSSWSSGSPPVQTTSRRAEGELRAGQLLETASASSWAVAEFPSAGSIGAHELGIAEAAGCVGPVLFPAAPEIATGEAAEDGWPPGVGALTLEGVEDFLDGVGHPAGER